MNRNIFNTSRNQTDTMNHAGGKAYSKTAEQHLAQLACTGTFNNTYYVSGKSQLETVKTLLPKVDDGYLARLAVYSRQSAGMKDMSAFLLASLCQRNSSLFEQAAPKVLINGKMVRNFVQVFRSGVLGRKTIPRVARRVLADWLNNRPEHKLINDSVGNQPSIKDVIRMVHPKPVDKSRADLFAFLLGKELEECPPTVRSLRDFQTGVTDIPPNLEFRLLTGKPLSTAQWVAIALNMPWHALRINLNTLQRHGVFDEFYQNQEENLVSKLAQKLSDPETIHRSFVMPYQIMTAYLNVDPNLPYEIRDALQEALEISTMNIPPLKGSVVVGVDTSGSMQNPITGYQRSATTKTTCVDVAALVASSLLRKNPSTRVIPFDQRNQSDQVWLNSRDSIITNADKLRKVGGGGTNCSIPLMTLNQEKAHVDLYILVSDNESWQDSSWNRHQRTETMNQWNILKKRCPKAKMINIDITPNGTSQTKDQKDIYNIGGFSDSVFKFIEAISYGDQNQWINRIKETPL